MNRLAALSLRDFWFPALLFLSAAALALAAMYGRIWRRFMLAAAIILAALGAISFVVGDPVRGPFAHLIHPHAKDTITFHAGMSRIVATKQLSDGYDFSDVIKFEGFPQPLQLRIQKSWSFRWRVTLRLVQDNTAILDVEHNEVRHIDSYLDVNHDDKALE